MKKLLACLALLLSTQTYSQVVCDSLNTLYAYSYMNHGAMFNVVAKTNNVTLDHLTANIKNGTRTYHIYYKLGSFEGYETQPSAWTLIDSASVVSNNTLTINNQPTVIPINLNLTMNAGDTIAIYQVAPALSNTYLTTTTTPWATEYVADTAISISVARSCYQLFNVPFSTPQIWNGTVNYCVPGSVGVESIHELSDNILFTHSSGYLSVQIPQELLNQTDNLQFQVTDLLSRNVVNQKLSTNSSSFDTSSFVEGIYICTVIGKSGVLKQQKVFIR